MDREQDLVLCRSSGANTFFPSSLRPFLSHTLIPSLIQDFISLPAAVCRPHHDNLGLASMDMNVEGKGFVAESLNTEVSGAS